MWNSKKIYKSEIRTSHFSSWKTTCIRTNIFLSIFFKIVPKNGCREFGIFNINGFWKTVASPLLTQWTYCSLALSHRHDNLFTSRALTISLSFNNIHYLGKWSISPCGEFRQTARNKGNPYNPIMAARSAQVTPALANPLVPWKDNFHLKKRKFSYTLKL